MKKAILFFMIVLFPLGFLLFFGLALDHKFQTLPYYHASELLNDSTDNEFGKTYTIPDFEFTNFDGEVINKDYLKGNVYLMAPYSLESKYVSVITKRLLTANFKYRDEDNIKIIGLNSDGDIQDQKKLSDYRTNLFVNSDDSENFFYLSAENPQKMRSFISEGLGVRNIDNSAIVVLIDIESKIRGRYNLNLEKQINNAIEDMALLRKEIDIAEYEAEKANRNN